VSAALHTLFGIIVIALFSNDLFDARMVEYGGGWKHYPTIDGLRCGWCCIYTLAGIGPCGVWIRPGRVRNIGKLAHCWTGGWIALGRRPKK
jgi:hypothetical protein